MDNIDKERLEREINILKNTFHYNIIKIYQVKETSNILCMIMEYAEGGELFNYIIEKGSLTEDECRNIFQQIIDGIYYLHRMGICHRDLKPENILFDTKEKKRIKIIDFGLSNLYIYSDKKKDFLETPCGSPGYAPPEMILGEKYDGIMTDIWSCGIILYAMMFGCLPFDDYDEEKLYRKIIEGKYEYPNDITISEEAKNFINSILVVNPKYRANINDIKNNKWFKKNYKPSIGLFNSICEIPVSNIIVRDMIKMGYNKNKIVNYIKNNNHNNLTAIYYLLVKQKFKKGIETESDLISNYFQEYIKKQYNKLINNIDINPISLKEIIVRKEKEKEKSNDDNKSIKKTLETFHERKKIDINFVHKNNNDLNNINTNKESKRKNKIDNNKEKGNKKYFNSGNNNININNIKNIHYININNIKTNFLMKAFETENNHKLIKKINKLSKSRKDISKSNSKNKLKKSQKIKNINSCKAKEGKDVCINLNYYKNKKNSSKAKKINLNIKNNIKNNKTLFEESNKDISISSKNNLNNKYNRNTFTLENKNLQILSYNTKNSLKNKNIRNKLYLAKLPTYGNFISKQKISNSIKKTQLLKDKEKDIYISFILNNKTKRFKIDSFNQLLNNLKSLRIRKKRYMGISESNSKSKSSSNSRAKSKSSTNRDKFKQNGFFAFNSSRNYNQKSLTKKSMENKPCNLTHEKLLNIKKLNKTLSKDRQKKLDRLELNLKQNKSLKISSKPKHDSTNNYNIYIQDNLNKNKNKHMKIKPINYINILINNKKKNIYRNNTTNLEYPKININNSNMNLSTKIEKSFNYANSLTTKERIKKNELNTNKNLKENLLTNNLNFKFKLKIKNKLNLRKKLNELNKPNNADNISNTINTFDTLSRDIIDISSLKVSTKTKNSKLNHNIIKAKKSNNKLQKKIQLGNVKPLKFKNILIFQDSKKPYTYRKPQKFLDEAIFKLED